MGDSAVKMLRNQLRQVVLELLPNVVKEELFKALTKDVMKRIDDLEKFTKEQLSEINRRHKDTMGYLVRSVSKTSEK